MNSLGQPNSLNFVQWIMYGNRKKYLQNKIDKSILIFLDGISGEYYPFDSYETLRKYNNKVIELINLFSKSLKNLFSKGLPSAK